MILSLLDQQYNRYRLAEGQLLRAHQTMTTKIPEIEKTIQMIECLAKKPSTDYAIKKWMWTSSSARASSFAVELATISNT